jgi:hypothetical protein
MYRWAFSPSFMSATNKKQLVEQMYAAEILKHECSFRETKTENAKWMLLGIDYNSPLV